MVSEVAGGESDPMTTGNVSNEKVWVSEPVVKNNFIVLQYNVYVLGFSITLSTVSQLERSGFLKARRRWDGLELRGNRSSREYLKKRGFRLLFTYRSCMMASCVGCANLLCNTSVNKKFTYHRREGC